MTDVVIPPDLFAAAGIEIVERPAPKAKRTRKLKLPSPAERAAKARAHTGRRERRLAPNGERIRIGSPRDLSPRTVFAYPLSRNTGLLEKAVSKLPTRYDAALDQARDREAERLSKRLIRKGLPKKTARECANELMHHAYMVRAEDAWKEM